MRSRTLNASQSESERSFVTAGFKHTVKKSLSLAAAGSCVSAAAITSLCSASASMSAAGSAILAIFRFTRGCCVTFLCPIALATFPSPFCVAVGARGRGCTTRKQGVAESSAFKALCATQPRFEPMHDLLHSRPSCKWFPATHRAVCCFSLASCSKIF